MNRSAGLRLLGRGCQLGRQSGGLQRVAWAIPWTLLPRCPHSRGSVPLFILERAWEEGRTAHNGDPVGLDCTDIDNGRCLLCLRKSYVILKDGMN